MVSLMPLSRSDINSSARRPSYFAGIMENASTRKLVRWIVIVIVFIVILVSVTSRHMYVPHHVREVDVRCNNNSMRSRFILNVTLMSMIVDKYISGSLADLLVNSSTVANASAFITNYPLQGRLGNHLFQLASAYGIAKRNGRKLITWQHFCYVSLTSTV